MKNWSLVIASILSLGIAGCANSPETGAIDKADKKADASALIPRDVLFGNADKAQGKLSWDGKLIAFVAPVDGVLNVWVGPSNDLSAAKPVTNDRKRGIMQYQWAYTNQHILYLQDEGGNENWNIHVVDLNSGENKNLTPNPKVTARITQLSNKYPDEVIIGINDRSPIYHDLHRINIRTGKDVLVFQNAQEINGNNVAGHAVDE